MNTDRDSAAALRRLFSPQSIAVVGASANAAKIGGIPVDYLRRLGWQGELHAVNPNADSVQGLPAHPSISAIGRPVDLAIMAVPQAHVAAALDDAIAAQVAGCVLFSAGYAEVGEQGAAAQAALAAKARAAGVRLLGPNCLGFMNVAQSVYATFSPAPRAGLVRPGRIGLVSQSGAFGAYAYAMARERGVGLSLWATTGNEADLQVADVLDHLVGDPGTDVIMAYLEGCRDGPRLRASLAAAQQCGKPVVMVKVGTTPLGAQAAASHTAALAGDDAVYEAVFRRYGVLRARTLTEFFDIAHAAAIAGRPRDRSVGLFTLSGGVGAMMADEAAQAGLDVRPLSGAAQATLQQWVPFAAPRNPVDITGQVTNDLSLMARSAQLMLHDQGFASWLGFFAAAGASDAFWPVLRSLVAELRQAHPDAVLVISTLLSAERRAELETLRCLHFTDPSAAVRVLAALAGTTTARERPGAMAGASAPVALPAGTLSEAQSLRLLAEAGVPVVPHVHVHGATDAAQAARRFDGEVVVKVCSADLPHKSDVGGVALGVRAEAAAEAFLRTRDAVAAARPQARLDGALIAPMVRGGVECLAGVRRDPVFGPVLVVGLGGIHVEALRDVAVRVLPVDREDVLEMLAGLRGAALLDGVRGREAVDREALVEAVLALAAFAQRAGDRLESVEINPLIARPAGEGGCVAVDALVIGMDPATETEE
jgi:acyl-CoA synthetase (NDP forming)